jgi:cytochrome c-type biogenesis protein CcmF
VYNAIIESFGFVSNMAPPADQISHYTKFQLWFAVIITILSAIGQFFWWKRIDKNKLISSLTTPVLVTLLVSALVIVLAPVNNLVYIVLLTTSIFSIVANGKILLGVARNNYKLSGGAVAHIGVAMMLVGIMFSSGYSRVVSINTSGLLLPGEFFEKDDNKETKENVFLTINQPTRMDNYWITYRGKRIEARNVPGFLQRNQISPTKVDYKVVAKEDIVQNGKVYYKKGDTLEIYAENTYFEVEYRDDKGRIFSLYPRAQINEQMGGILASPDIKHTATRDIYTHVNAVADPDAAKEWSKMEEQIVSIGDTFFVNDYVAVLDNVLRVSEVEGIVLSAEDAAVKAKIRILGKDREYEVLPTYLIKDRMVGRIPEEVEDLGLKITFTNIDPAKGTFTFGVNTTQKDWIIMKAREMPYINVLWIGTFIMTIGFILAISRRYSEFAKMRNKAIKVNA